MISRKPKPRVLWTLYAHSMILAVRSWCFINLMRDAGYLLTYSSNNRGRMCRDCITFLPHTCCDEVQYTFDFSSILLFASRNYKT